jgi:hypothetical protein
MQTASLPIYYINYQTMLAHPPKMFEKRIPLQRGYMSRSEEWKRITGTSAKQHRRKTAAADERRVYVRYPDE